MAIIEATLDEMRNDYNWTEAFGFAGGGDACNHGLATVIGSDAEACAFGLNDVAEVVASSNGEHDERDWLCAVRLKDGRWASLRAGCDYTGWD